MHPKVCLQKWAARVLREDTKLFAHLSPQMEGITAAGSVQVLVTRHLSILKARGQAFRQAGEALEA